MPPNYSFPINNATDMPYLSYPTIHTLKSVRGIFLRNFDTKVGLHFDITMYIRQFRRLKYT